LPSETVAALYEATTGLQIFALKPQGESRAANLLKVMEIARAVETSGNHSLHQLVMWLDRLEELRVGEEDSPIAEAGDDVVQLMTFHKAKGLEFPVVLLYRLSHDHELRHASCLVDRGSKAVEFSMSGVQTAGYAASLEDEKDRQWHETIRLLYVAMTRARDLLVIPAYWSKERSEETRDRQWFFKLLRSRLAAEDNGSPAVHETEFAIHSADKYSLEIPLEERLVLDLQEDYSTAQVAQSREDYAAWQAMRQGHVALLERSKLFIKPSDHDDAVPEFAISATHQAEHAKRFGTFMHLVLERILLPGGENAEEVIASAAAEYSMDEAARGEARTLLSRVLGSDLFACRIRASKQLWRELNFVTRVEGGLVEGSMDLVFMENGHPVIADFKTDNVTAEFVVRRAGMYTRQAGAYVRALEEIIGGSVPEVLLYFVRPDVVIAVPREQLAEFLS
jgi:ATP-dependent helicase/nuclease subunit A